MRPVMCPKFIAGNWKMHTTAAEASIREGDCHGGARDASRTLRHGTGFAGDGAVRAYSCGFSFGAAGCRMASSQRRRVRLIALSCSHLSLSAR